MLRYSQAIIFACLLLLFAWKATHFLFPELARNQDNISLMKALDRVEIPFIQRDWLPCNTSVTLQDEVGQHGRPALGALAQLDCPTAIQFIPVVDTRATLNEIDVLWFGYALQRKGLYRKAIDLWRLYPTEIGKFFIALANFNHGMGTSPLSKNSLHLLLILKQTIGEHILIAAGCYLMMNLSWLCKHSSGRLNLTLVKRKSILNGAGS